MGAHLQHVDPGYKRPFSQAIMDSGGPTARVWAQPAYPLYEYQTSLFLNATGCDRGADAFGTYDCLRALPTETIRNASVTVYNAYTTPVQWPWQPVIDGKYVYRSPTESYRTGQFNKIPVITGFNSDEGRVFVPNTYNTSAQFRDYMTRLLPLANSSIIDQIEQLYPDPVANPNSQFNLTFPGVGVQYARLGAAFGDYAYVSSVRQSALALSQYQQGANNVWKYHFDQGEFAH